MSITLLQWMDKVFGRLMLEILNLIENANRNKVV